MNMENMNVKTVRDIALAAPATTRVFEEFKIDYCCGGRRSLAEASQTAGIDLATLTQRLDAVMNAPLADSNPPEEMSPSRLVDYILEKHHVFTAQELERLAPLMAKVVAKHGERDPELFELQTVFAELAESLTPHMRKEETVLFPYIQALDAGVASAPHFGTVLNPIRMMEADHDADGERLRRMRQITNNYLLPAEACPSFAALYAGLEDLERDLHRHIHLENNVLFPQAAILESNNH